jgi:dTDP-glucose 4,6-dehydratase
MPIMITRSSNNFGPRQNIEKFIPVVIMKILKGEKIPLYGTGENIRDWIFVEDNVLAIWEVLLGGQSGEIYNIGCDEGMEYSVKQVAQILIQMIKNTDNYDNWIEFIADRPFNDKRYYISNQKLKNLGWDIQINFLDGLKELV